VIRREAEGAGLSDTSSSIAARHQRGGGAGAAIDPQTETRTAAGAYRRDGLRAQTQSEMFAAMGEGRPVIGNDDKMRGQAWRQARAAFDVDDSEKVAVSDIMAVREMARIWSKSFSKRAAARLRAGAERLRPSLHVLHHPVRPRQFAFGAMGAVVDQVRALAERGHARSC